MQMPNLSLWLFLILTVIQVVFHLSGNAGPAVSIVSLVVLLYWALGEVAQGVNPFRRLLGGAVLLFELLSHIFH